MINIRQITQRDLTNAPTVAKSGIRVGGVVLNQVDYKIIDSNKLGSNQVFKIGYCVADGPGMNYPIFMKLNDNPDSLTTFYIGKTGMFEFQPEKWQDEDVQVTCSEIQVPAGFDFVLDYCYNN